MTPRAFWVAMAATLGVGLPTVSACPTIIRHRAVVVEKVVVTKVIVPEVVPVAVYAAIPVLVPSYGVSYGAPPVTAAPAYGAQADPCAQRMAVLQRQIDELKALVGPKRGGDPKSTAPMERAPEDATGGLAVLNSRCASCHEAAVAAVKGSGFMLTDAGRLRDLTNRQTNKVLRMIRPESEGSKPKMPKDAAALSDEEVKKIEDLFNSQ